MTDWRSIPRHKLPVAIPREIVESEDNLYDYRKPDHYYEHMPDFQTLHDAINDHDCTLRELMYDITEFGHIYYVLPCQGCLGPIALMWTRCNALLTERGQKRYRKILDSEVVMHERGVLYIYCDDVELFEEFRYGLMDIGDGTRYFHYGKLHKH